MVTVGPHFGQTSAANTNCTCEFQAWANHVTTAHPVNTHGYHNHVCSGVSCGYMYDIHINLT